MKRIALFLIWSMAASAATVITNLPVFDSTSGGQFGPTGGLVRAMGFTTGSEDVKLTSIQVGVFNSLTVPVSIKLKVVANTSGDDPFFSLPFVIANNTGAGISNGLIAPEATLVSSSTLFANTSYWLVMQITFAADPDLTGRFDWVQSDPPKTPIGAYASHKGGRVSSDGGATWTNDNLLLSYQLNGTIPRNGNDPETPGVPEPATMGLCGLAGLLFLLMRVRKAPSI